MICLFWAVYFAIRACRGDEEPRVKWSILLFYVASTVLYTDHWLYFSDVASTIGEYSYFFANLTVYPIYYMYLRALTRTRLTWDNYVLFLPAVVILIFFNIGLKHDYSPAKYTYLRGCKPHTVRIIHRI